MNNQKIAKTITKRLAQQKRQQINKIVDNWKETKMDQITISKGKRYKQPIWIVRTIAGKIVTKSHHPIYLSIHDVIDRSCEGLDISPDDFLTNEKQTASVFLRLEC